MVVSLRRTRRLQQTNLAELGGRDENAELTEDPTPRGIQNFGMLAEHLFRGLTD